MDKYIDGERCTPSIFNKKCCFSTHHTTRTNGVTNVYMHANGIFVKLRTFNLSLVCTAQF